MKWGRITGPELAKILGISDRAIRELADRSIVVRDTHGSYECEASILAYCAHLREIAAGRGGEQAVLSLSEERARLAKEQADGQAMKNAALRRELLEAGAVEREWAGMLQSVRSAMLAVPSRIRQRLALAAADVDVIDREIRDALTELADERSAA